MNSRERLRRQCNSRKSNCIGCPLETYKTTSNLGQAAKNCDFESNEYTDKELKYAVMFLDYDIMKSDLKHGCHARDLI